MASIVIEKSQIHYGFACIKAKMTAAAMAANVIMTAMRNSILFSWLTAYAISYFSVVTCESAIPRLARWASMASIIGKGPHTK